MYLWFLRVREGLVYVCLKRSGELCKHFSTILTSLIIVIIYRNLCKINIKMCFLLKILLKLQISIEIQTDSHTLTRKNFLDTHFPGNKWGNSNL